MGGGQHVVGANRPAPGHGQNVLSLADLSYVVLPPYTVLLTPGGVLLIKKHFAQVGIAKPLQQTFAMDVMRELLGYGKFVSAPPVHPNMYQAPIEDCLLVKGNVTCPCKSFQRRVIFEWISYLVPSLYVAALLDFLLQDLLNRTHRRQERVEVVSERAGIVVLRFQTTVRSERFHQTVFCLRQRAFDLVLNKLAGDHAE